MQYSVPCSLFKVQFGMDGTGASGRTGRTGRTSMTGRFRRASEGLQKDSRRVQGRIKKGLRRALGSRLEATWRSEGHLKA